MENELQALRALYVHGYMIVMFLLGLLAPTGVALVGGGSARFKHRFASLWRVILLFPLTLLATFLFGWMLYHAFAAGPGITAGFRSVWHAVPWSDAMGPGFHRDAGGGYAIGSLRMVIFALFSWFAAGLLAGATQERIRAGGLMMLSVVLSSVFLAIGAAWGWSARGWMVELMGFHDPFGLGVLATLAGGFALGVLNVLGPRIGAVDDRGQMQGIAAGSEGMVLCGRAAMIIGSMAIAYAALVPAGSMKLGTASIFAAENIYGAPVPMSAPLLNILMAAAGGMVMGHVLTGRDGADILTLPIAAIIAIAPGADFYHPLEAFILALVLSFLCRRARQWLDRRFHLDDVIGAVALHGFAGFWGLVIAGILLWGYPASPRPDFAHINPFGQAAGAMLLFWLLGFLPGYLSARILDFFGVLRLDRIVELAGQDIDRLRRSEEMRHAAYQRERGVVNELIEEAR